MLEYLKSLINPKNIINFFSTRTTTRDVFLALLVAFVVNRVISKIFRMRRCSSERQKLQGSLCVISGASQGIGRCIALDCSRRYGAHVLLFARSEDKLNAVAEECKKAGAKSATVVVGDITKKEDIARLGDSVKQQLASSTSSLGLVVLNAGRGAICQFDETAESENIARELMEVNYFSNVNICRTLLPTIRQDKSDILVISSLSGILSTPLRTQYCGSKFALQGFFNALRLELGTDKHTVTIACPGFVQTAFHSAVMTTSAAGGKAPERQGKFMFPEECSDLSLNALEEGVFELPMTLKGKLGYCLRPFLPTVVDAAAAKVAQGSMKK